MSVYTPAIVLAASMLSTASAQQTAGLIDQGTNEYRSAGYRHAGTLPFDHPVRGAAIDVANRVMYLGITPDPGPASISKVDIDNFKVIDTLAVEPGEDLITRLVYHENSRMLYAAVWGYSNHGSPMRGTIVKIEASTFERVDSFTMYPHYWFGVDSREGGSLYVSDDETLYRIDPETMTVVNQATFHFFSHAEIDSSRGVLYHHNPARLAKIDLETLEVIDTIPLKHEQVLATGSTALVSPDGKALYLGFPWGGWIAKVDLESFSSVPLYYLEGSKNSWSHIVSLDSVNEVSIWSTWLWQDPDVIHLIENETFTKLGELPISVPEASFLAVSVGGFDPGTLSSYLPANVWSTRDRQWTGQLLKVTSARDQSLNATRIDLPEPATIHEMRFYSHVAEGNIRFALYNDAKPKSLLWQSPEIANTVEEGEIIVPIADGEPPALNLPAGTYWAAFQIDTRADVPSYTPGGEGEGWIAPYRFGPAPLHVHDGPTTATLPFVPGISAVSDDELTTQTERWTQYVTYEAFKADQWVVE